MKKMMSKTKIGIAVAGLIALCVLGVWLTRDTRETEEQAETLTVKHLARLRPGRSSDGDSAEAPTVAKPSASERRAAERVRVATPANKVPPTRAANRADSDEPSEKRIKAIEAWEGFVDKVAEREGVPTDEQARQFKREFAKLDKEDQLDGMQTALNLLPDEQFALLYPILFDKTMDPDLLDAIFSDGLNHDDEIKIPMMKAIYQDKDHPLNEEAERILDATGELDPPPDDEEDGSE